ncbi:hypothetical protein C8R46DRAFT_1228037 [Mycena filopes]|nr:hypothetical protein C8R46DRAFT_1228037 [Mycena filopes]
MSLPMQNGCVHGSPPNGAHDHGYRACSVPFHPGFRYNLLAHERNRQRLYYFVKNKEHPGVFTNAADYQLFTEGWTSPVTVKSYSGLRALSHAIYRWCRRLHNHEVAPADHAALASNPSPSLDNILDYRKDPPRKVTVRANPVATPSPAGVAQAATVVVPSPVTTPSSAVANPYKRPSATRNQVVSTLPREQPASGTSQSASYEAVHAIICRHSYAYGLSEPTVTDVESMGPGFSVLPNGRAFIDPESAADAIGQMNCTSAKKFGTLREATMWLTGGLGYYVFSDGEVFQHPEQAEEHAQLYQLYPLKICPTIRDAEDWLQSFWPSY